MKEKFKGFWNVPNMLSLFRLLLVPVLVITFFYVPGEDYIAPLIVFVIASITDTLDGIIARVTNNITEVGIVLDPLADKLLKIATLICFGIVDVIPVWLVVTLIVVDVAMIITGVCLYKRNITIPSNFIGKAGTFVMSVGLIMCFFHSRLNGWDTIILYSGLIIIVISVIVYIAKNAGRVFGKKTTATSNTGADVKVVDTTAQKVSDADNSEKESKPATIIEVPAQKDSKLDN